MNYILSKRQWLDQVEIRLANQDDLAGLEWDGEYKHFRRIYADAFHRMVQGLSLIWIAEIEPVGIIGQVFIQLVCDRAELADGEKRAYLYSFRVRPNYQDRGLGTLMMQIVEGDLHERGFQYVTLNVAKDNLRARKLYERRGFRVMAHEPGCWSYPDEKGVWHSVEEPAWRMEKCLVKDCERKLNRPVLDI
jgi:ribosomal protein S18 acetylase RimI-like enzyme